MNKPSIWQELIQEKRFPSYCYHQMLLETQDRLIHSEKLLSLGTLVAGVAHEINNPVNFICGGATHQENRLDEFKAFLFQLAGDEAQEVKVAFDERFAQQHNYLNTIKNGGQRIKHLVEQLSAFSRFDSADKQLININEGIQSTVALATMQYGKQVAFECDLDTVPPIYGWPNRLNQVFMNLVVNACQAIVSPQQKGGVVKIGCVLEAQQICITFVDNGSGIDSATQQKMFDPFFTTKEVGKGTGRGLSISLDIIRQHRGTLEVCSTEGEGAKITIMLPVEAGA